MSESASSASLSPQERVTNMATPGEQPEETAATLLVDEPRLDAEQNMETIEISQEEGKLVDQGLQDQNQQEKYLEQGQLQGHQQGQLQGQQHSLQEEQESQQLQEQEVQQQDHQHEVNKEEKQETVEVPEEQQSPRDENQEKEQHHEQRQHEEQEQEGHQEEEKQQQQAAGQHQQHQHSQEEQESEEESVITIPQPHRQNLEEQLEQESHPRIQLQATPKRRKSLQEIQQQVQLYVHKYQQLQQIEYRGQHFSQMEGEADTEPVVEDTVLRDEMTFIQNVSRFFNEETLSDVIIKLGEHRFFAHKFVLAKSSEVFMKMLYEQAWSQNVKEEIELQESPECIVVFDKFLRYLYTAEVHINTTSAVGILCLSDKYCVDSLKQLCIQYMIENVRSPKVQNALNWYPWAKALCLPSLLDQCMKTIAWNAQDIITSPEWLTFDTEFVFDMVNNSELVIRNEYSLLESLIKWLMHESRVEQLEEHCSELLPLIRFPMMQSQQLFQLEHSDLSQNKKCYDLLQKLLSQAYRFRALCTSQPHLSANFDEACFHPRDYVELTVDNVRMQNTLRFGIQVDVKMYRGPVPQETRDGDWKLTYRKTQVNIWQLQVYGHDTAMVNSEAKVALTVLVYNDQEKVIQVERGPVSTVSRGNCITMTITISDHGAARNMALLIKTVAT